MTAFAIVVAAFILEHGISKGLNKIAYEIRNAAQAKKED